MHLEDLVVVRIISLETFYGHRGSHVFPIGHVCKSTVEVNSPDVYRFVLEKE